VRNGSDDGFRPPTRHSLHPHNSPHPHTHTTVGDTWPVGCPHDASIVYHELFALNPDAADARFASSPTGVYAPACGLSNVHFSWGHDQYLFQVLSAHAPCALPPAALFIVRHHSCYAIHSAGAYSALFDESDRALLPWLRCDCVCVCLLVWVVHKGVTKPCAACKKARAALSPTSERRTPSPPHTHTNQRVSKVRPVLQDGRRARRRRAQALLRRPDREVRPRRQAALVMCDGGGSRRRRRRRRIRRACPNSLRVLTPACCTDFYCLLFFAILHSL
jgi:hypothetical protein